MRFTIFGSKASTSQTCFAVNSYGLVSQDMCLNQCYVSCYCGGVQHGSSTSVVARSGYCANEDLLSTGESAMVATPL